MSSTGGSAQLTATYGGKAKIVGNDIGGTNQTVAKFPSAGSTVMTLNLNPKVKHRLNMDIAGYTSVSYALTQDNVERIDAAGASFSSTQGPVALTAGSNFLGVVDAGNTAIRLTVVKTASSPADDSTLVTSLGARAVLSIVELGLNRGPDGSIIAPPYTGPVISGDDATPLFTSA